jgi:uncharacterized membrane protein HdeD (DUF308 family)
MTDTAEPTPAVPKIGDEVKHSAGWLIVLGILSVILGILAINAPLLSGVAVTILIGCYLIANGIFQLVAMFRAKGLGAGILAFVLGALAIVAGILVLSRPMMGLAVLTLWLAAFFIVEGIARAILSFQVRPLSGWGWMLFGGIVSVLLGIMIWSKWPLSGIWAIGVLVGVHIIFAGWTQIFIGLAARKGVDEVREAVASA